MSYGKSDTHTYVLVHVLHVDSDVKLELFYCMTIHPLIYIYLLLKIIGTWSNR